MSATHDKALVRPKIVRGGTKGSSASSTNNSK